MFVQDFQVDYLPNYVHAAKKPLMILWCTVTSMDSPVSQLKSQNLKLRRLQVGFPVYTGFNLLKRLNSFGSAVNFQILLSLIFFYDLYLLRVTWSYPGYAQSLLFSANN